MIYIGVDPEPSGAFCVWESSDLKGSEYIKFYTSNPEIYKRVHVWEQVTKGDSFLFGPFKRFTREEMEAETEIVVAFIEECHQRPRQNIKAGTKTVLSYGAWLALLYSAIPMEDVYIIPPATWKKELELTELSKSKIESYRFAKSILDDPKENIQYDKKELKLSSLVPEKQIYDRCEAFLLAYYGRYFLLGEAKEDNGS